MVLPLLLSFLGSGMAQAGVLGAAGSFLANPLVAGAIGSGIGTAIETGDVKQGLVGGLGAFAGGKALGSLMGSTAPAAADALPLAGQSTVGSGASAMTTGTPLYAQPGMTGSALMPPAAAPAPAAGLGGIARGGANFMGSAEGMGMMLGGTLAPAALGMGPGSGGSGSSGTSATAPRQAPAMQRTPATPPAGYRPTRQPTSTSTRRRWRAAAGLRGWCRALVLCTWRLAVSPM